MEMIVKKTFKNNTTNKVSMCDKGSYKNITFGSS